MRNGSGGEDMTTARMWCPPAVYSLGLGGHDKPGFVMSPQQKPPLRWRTPHPRGCHVLPTVAAAPAYTAVHSTGSRADQKAAGGAGQDAFKAARMRSSVGSGISP
jgi:hypothetical protein